MKISEMRLNFSSNRGKLIIIITCISLFLIGYIINKLHIKTDNNPDLKIEFNDNSLMQFRGIVISKYNDKNNHKFGTIELKLDNDTIYKWIPYGKNGADLFNFININDSIIKTDYGFTYKVVRTDLDTIFTTNPS